VDMQEIEGQDALAFGHEDPGPFGITFTCSVEVPEPFTGMPLLVQVYSYDRAAMDFYTGWRDKEGSGLDKKYPYSVGTYADDSPFQGLPGKFCQAHVSDSADMWFMFKPPGEDSIPVPLIKVHWWWGGSAYNPYCPGAFWPDEPDNAFCGHYAPEETTDYPEWDINGEDIPWKDR